MTTAIDFTENTSSRTADHEAYSKADGLLPPSRRRTPSRSNIPRNHRRRMATHGDAFTYRTPNTDVVGWLIARTTGESLAAVLSKRLWSRIGAEDDAYLVVDEDGTPQVGLSLNVRLRDIARLGELMRLGGNFNGQQIVPSASSVTSAPARSREAFVKAGYPTLPGWSYQNQWWVSHDDHGAFMARGIHGQAIYIDPKAEMVIARFASHPLGGQRQSRPNVPSRLPRNSGAFDALTLDEEGPVAR